MSGKACPRCKTDLKEFHLTGGPDIDICPSCDGAFYEQGELSIPAIAKGLAAGDAPCPSCGLSMYLGKYGGDGPELDYCTQCGGIWADKGEIDEIRRLSGQADLVGASPGPSGPAEAVPSGAGPAAASAAGLAASSVPAAAKARAANAVRPATGHRPPGYSSGTCWWDEFLLYSPEQGYAWLVQENGHFTLVKTTKVRPAMTLFGRVQKSWVSVGTGRYQVYEEGSAVLDAVEGETTWIAKPGDEVRSVDLIAPPRVYSVERDGAELEYFEGTYVEPEEVFQGFGLKGSPPARSGVHAAQPFIESDAARQIKWWSAAFAAVFLAFLVQVMMSGKGVLVFGERFQAQSGAAPFVSRPFEVRDQNVIFRLNMHSPLDNQWVWLDFDVLDANDQPVGEFSNQLSYYHGYEDGESWSEGGHNESVLFRVLEPGVYKLQAVAEGGTDEAVGSISVPVTLELFSNYQPRRYFLLSFLIALAVAAWGFMRKAMFEQQRWAAVIEDDDDD